MADKDHMPIVYPLRAVPEPLRAPGQPSGRLCLRVCARALQGMQKEALVDRSPRGTTWRLLCDEGPYLDGTDLAPPPLAYFAAGMAAHNAALVLEEAGRAGMDLGQWSLRQDSYYTMEGSALQGNMAGGALPAQLRLQSDSADQAALRDLAAAALRGSVAEAVMASECPGVFSIRHNGAPIGNGRVKAAPGPAAEIDPTHFDGIVRGEPPSGMPQIIRKLKSVEPSTDATHGQGASLREFQKRELHLRTVLRPWGDGLLASEVQLLRPLGSTFGFLAAGPVIPEERAAPDGLDYLAAGIALCFLTQMGRYAKIVRGDLGAYSVVQDLLVEREPVAVLNLVTHAFVASGEDQDTVRRYVDMSEQTCFLHASCRSTNPTQIETEGNP